MDKLGEYAKDDCKMTEKVYDAMWGGDPHFPHWNLGDRGERVMTVISPPNRPTKPAPIPYSGGSKPEPKLEWKVETKYRWPAIEVDPYVCVSLYVDGKRYLSDTADDYGLFASEEKRIKRCKASILARYNLCKKESGRVEQ